MGRTADEDPLTIAIAPPPGETEEQKQHRLQEEAEARRISDEIDQQLKEERAALKKKKKPIKVLLLGQSESGKSTTLKNFQLNYAKQAWSAERAAWRTIIQLNLLRNVNTILDVLHSEMTSSPSDSPDSSDSDDDDGRVRVVPRTSSGKDTSLPPLRFTEQHRLLKLRLLPLRSVLSDIQNRLGLCDYPTPATSTETNSKHRNHELFVWSHAPWKSTVARKDNGGGAGQGQGHARRPSDATLRRKGGDEAETSEIIASCKEDMQALWEDSVIQEMLKRRRLRLDLMPGFFLQDVSRIARRDYTPSDDDVVRARLRTLGVQEHRILFETGPAAGLEWCLYDVGGSRTQRPAWFPYFDDCDAIIFLAPISCFDEKLAEDRKVNRLEDSYQLWRMICSCKLLSKAQIILFLNKCDLLDKKLKSGIRVKDYVPSFGDRKNDLPTVAQYFAQHFKEIARQNSVPARPFRVHLTSVVDTHATALTLGVVGESILRSQLRNADLL
ncbi:guanine nucleotide binding protein, alpha subunit [Irpex rosettiformis]|uniref:Guanine nucleotide binding protein, alpha subunit n=1 Tax=Irpex rosettiformis TaxID=378272 RepID=A0ACB8TTT7_9APHY|nr:guanine nucleotide binding protein, alpha subunit [Irpex rosettiformis]